MNNSTADKVKSLNFLAEGINPTIIYNEGWMIRLLVMESMIEKLQINKVDFGLLATKNWSSEALITSPFVEAKVNKEGYTHADIILGDFSVNYNERGDINLNDSPDVLGIIEAKMGSNLSTGTSNADNYNQASRSICCLSYVTRKNPNCKLFFIVAAPEATINKYSIKKQVERENILTQIGDRFKHSEEPYMSEIKNQVEKCKLVIINYEDWLKELRNSEVQKMLYDFYKECLKSNNIKDI